MRKMGNGNENEHVSSSSILEKKNFISFFKSAHLNFAESESVFSNIWTFLELKMRNYVIWDIYSQ